MYAAEHEMSLQMEGLSKPKRKRGRPPKCHTENMSMVCKDNIFVQYKIFYFDSNFRN